MKFGSEVGDSNASISSTILLQSALGQLVERLGGFEGVAAKLQTEYPETCKLGEEFKDLFPLKDWRQNVGGVSVTRRLNMLVYSEAMSRMSQKKSVFDEVQNTWSELWSEESTLLHEGLTKLKGIPNAVYEETEDGRMVFNDLRELISRLRDTYDTDVGSALEALVAVSLLTNRGTPDFSLSRWLEEPTKNWIDEPVMGPANPGPLSGKSFRAIYGAQAMGIPGFLRASDQASNYVEFGNHFSEYMKGTVEEPPKMVYTFVKPQSFDKIMSTIDFPATLRFEERLQEIFDLAKVKLDMMPVKQVISRRRKATIGKNIATDWAAAEEKSVLTAAEALAGSLNQARLTEAKKGREAALANRHDAFINWVLFWAKVTAPTASSNRLP